jgi:hypothetical protein
MTPASKPTAPSFIPSPCVSLCKINRDTELCEGCRRTLDEIVAWGSAGDAYKIEVWRKIELRKTSSDVIS